VIRATTILRPKVARWSLMVCCEDSGMSATKIEQIQFGIGRGNFTFGTDFLDKHDLSVCGPPTKFQWLDGNHFRLSRKKYRCLGYTPWVGNRCWDACFVSTQTIREIATSLQQRGWRPEQGSTTLWDWWEKMQSKEDQSHA